MTTKPILQSFLRPTLSSLVSRVSITAGGSEGNGESSEVNAHVSDDGRYLVFSSAASNLVAGDTNGQFDIFRKDLLTGEVARISTATNGSQGNGDSFDPRISADGRYIFFSSAASNLVPDDTNGRTDIFRKDLFTGELVRVSMALDGAETNGSSLNTRLSSDGRYMLYESAANNLVAGDNNGRRDIFLQDLATGQVTRVSSAVDGSESEGTSLNPQISANGRYVVFENAASNLAGEDLSVHYDILRKDLATGEIIVVSTAADGSGYEKSSHNPQISADGRYVVFESEHAGSGDTNGSTDIFRKDLATGALVRVSTTESGAQAKGGSYDAKLSADGRYVVFTSDASNLVAGDANNQPDVFLKDLATGKITLLSQSASGTIGNGSSYSSFLSADGQSVFIGSTATNLVPGDEHDNVDIFRIDAALMAHADAVRDNRFVQVSFGTGLAASVSLAWGDGTIDTVTSIDGTAAFKHAYASTGTKAAIATVQEGDTSWAVPYLIDLATGAMTRNAAVASQIKGGASKDHLIGDAFADRLSGGLGNDVLDGGAGADVFVFNAKLGTSKTDRKVNFDTIKGFNPTDDTIWLDNAIFANKALKKFSKKASEDSPKMLSKKFFTVGSKARDKDDYFIYDKKKGVLSYDADGSGAKKAIEIAELDKKLKMTHKDLFIV